MLSRDLRRHIGQLVMAGFPAHTIPSELVSLSREFDLSGVVLFARNVAEPEQVADISRQAREMAIELPLWVSVDQEGGRVARLKGAFTRWPAMAALGRSGDEKLTARFAAALAAELRAVGISLDYTPVLDILTNASNPAIGDRALASKAEDVARLGRVIIDTLQSAGIAACGKHFPGHGDTSVDSHHDLPLVEHPPDRLRRVEMVPFRTAIEANVAGIMTAHLLIPSLDEERPATISRRIVTGILKEELGHRGLVFTDDMEMKGVSGKIGVPEAAVQAIIAGCDVALLCGPSQETQFATIEGLIRAAEDGSLSLKRIEDAMTRQRRVKERFLAAPQPVPLSGAALRAALGRDEYQAVAEEMARFA